MLSSLTRSVTGCTGTEGVSMRINASTAVSHIVNSMDSGHVDFWHDPEDGTIWQVEGRDNKLIFTFIDAAGNRTKQVFLVSKAVGG
jgi:hypothetical protein